MTDKILQKLIALKEQSRLIETSFFATHNQNKTTNNESK